MAVMLVLALVAAAAAVVAMVLVVLVVLVLVVLVLVVLVLVEEATPPQSARRARSSCVSSKRPAALPPSGTTTRWPRTPLRRGCGRRRTCSRAW